MEFIEQEIKKRRIIRTMDDDFEYCMNDLKENVSFISDNNLCFCSKLGSEFKKCDLRRQIEIIQQLKNIF